MVPVGKDFFKIVIVIPNMILALSYSNNFFPIYKGKYTIIQVLRMLMMKE
jgi:hypothetical protein